MAKIEIDRFFCKGCGLCIDVCPKKLIAFSKEAGEAGLFVEQTDAAECIACKLCAIQCPECAISVFK